MSDPLCHLCEDYLNRALVPRDQAAFVAHLTFCAACRQTVESQRHLDDLLRRAMAEREPLPYGITARVRSLLWRQEAQRRVVRFVALAAAILLWLGLQWLGLPRGEPRVSRDPVARMAVPPAPSSEPPPEVAVNFPVADSVIALPTESKSPHVTILWVYSTRRDVSETDLPEERSEP